MLPRYISSIWADIAPAIVNHLWQSTLFAFTVGLLTLVLRKNQARVRYWLWLTASCKFLIPFSLIVNIGTHLAHRRAVTEVQTRLYSAMAHPYRVMMFPLLSSASAAARSAASH
jgi:bla regulator protein blaR1